MQPSKQTSLGTHMLGLCVAVVVLVCDAASAPAVGNATAALHPGALQDWLVANGGQLDGVEVSVTEAGLGLRATRQLDGGAMFVYVPRSLVLCEAAALESAVVGPVINALYGRVDGEWTKQASTALFVLYEAFHNEQSLWSPYFQVLQRSAVWSPLDMNDDDWVLAKRVSLLSNMIRFPSNATVEFVMDNALAASPLVFGENTPLQRSVWAAQVRWAFAVVNTRSFSFGDWGHFIVPVLVRVVRSTCEAPYPAPQDFVNHDNSAAGMKNGAMVDAPGSVVGHALLTASPVQRGGEVFASYADPSSAAMCNHQMLSSWGFTLEDPRNMCCVLTLSFQVPPEAAGLRSMLEELAASPSPSAADTFIVSFLSRSSSPQLPPSATNLFSKTAAINDPGLDAADSTHQAHAMLLHHVRLLVEQSERGHTDVLQALPDSPSHWSPIQTHIERVSRGQALAAHHLLSHLQP